MPDLTTNYKLVKPLKNENYDIEVFNKNADILDRELKKREEAHTAHIEDTDNPHKVTAKQIGAATPEDLDKKAITATYTATLYSSSWSSSAPYTQTVAVAGILGTDNPITDVVLSGNAASAKAELEAWGKVSKIETNSGSITVTCLEEKPVGTLNIQMKVVR